MTWGLIETSLTFLQTDILKLLKVWYKSLDPIWRSNFLGCFSWKIKNGTSADFWHDNWHNAGVLSLVFKNLYTLTKDKYCSVQSFKHSWSTARLERRSLRIFDLLTTELQEKIILDIIMDYLILIEWEDVSTWGPFGGKLSFAACYRLLLNSEVSHRPWIAIWKLKIPEKVKLFLWQVLHKCLPTYSFLSTRGFQLVISCKWCKLEEETLKLVLWTCPLAKSARRIISYWLEIDILSSDHFELEIVIKCPNKYGFNIGGGIRIASMFWSVWLAKNDLVLNNHRMYSKSLEYLIKYCSLIWGKANKMVLQNQQVAWYHRPVNTIADNIRKAKQKIIDGSFQVSTLVGFIEGVWKSFSSTECKVGIGGFLLMIHHSTYFFQG